MSPPSCPATSQDIQHSSQGDTFYAQDHLNEQRRKSQQPTIKNPPKTKTSERCTDWALKGVRGHLTRSRIAVIQNSSFSALHLWDLHILTCSSRQMSATNGGPNLVQRSKTYSATVTFHKHTSGPQCCSTTHFTAKLPHTTSSPALILELPFCRRLQNVTHTHSDTTVSLPLLEACWGPEHALSR